MRKETRCHHIGYSFWLAARALLYAPSHRQNNTYHGLCYTSHGALAGTRNSSMGPPHEWSIWWPIEPWANALTTELRLAPTSHGVLVGTRNTSVGPPRGTNLTTHHTMSYISLPNRLEIHEQINFHFSSQTSNIYFDSCGRVNVSPFLKKTSLPHVLPFLKKNWMSKWGKLLLRILSLVSSIHHTDTV